MPPSRPAFSDINAETLDRFLALSTHLVGEGPLARDLAEAHLRRINTNALDLQESVTELLAMFDDIVASGNEINAAIRERIFSVSRLRASARRIIILWYLGELVNEKDEAISGAPEDYFRALMWEMIHAHPLGLSGGYFGYWKYPPEN